MLEDRAAMLTGSRIGLGLMYFLDPARVGIIAQADVARTGGEDDSPNSFGRDPETPDRRSR
jgi:hypothetical protein